MKMLFSSLAIGAALLAASPALGQVYGSVGAGLSIPEKTRLEMNTNTLVTPYDDGYHFEAAVGYDFGPIRAEIEASQDRSTVQSISDRFGRHYDISDQGFYRLGRTGMFNLMADVPLGQKVTFTAGGGVGLGRLTMRSKQGADCSEVIAMRVVHDDPRDREGPTNTCTDQGVSRDSGFAWQAKAGFNYKINTNWSIDVLGSYLRNENIETAGKSTRIRGVTPAELRYIGKVDYSSIRTTVAIRRYF